MKQPPRVHDTDAEDNYHLCPTTGLMTPFIPVGYKGKERKFKDRESVAENVPMRSWGETPGAYDASLGAPTRGRR